MTLVVTVDGDSAFDILVRSCMATDGNPNSGNVIQLTDDLGCILKPKIFGNFQMIKNPDPSRPSVVAYAYFQVSLNIEILEIIIRLKEIDNESFFLIVSGFQVPRCHGSVN